MLDSMMRPWLGFAFLLLASCHGPIPQGVYPCTTARDCPPAWVCRTDARCWSAEIDAAGADAQAIDTGPDADARADARADAGADAAAVDAQTRDAGWDANCPLVAYYADCDGDGFAAPGASTLFACSLPTATTPCSGGAWTTTEPTVGMTDCADQEPHAFPRSVYFSSDPAWTGSDGVRHFDYNCDGAETPLIVAHDLGPVSSCDFYQDPPPDTSYTLCYSSAGASPDRNWVGAVPACGVAGELNTCPPEVGLPLSQCHSTIRSTPQACN